MIKLCKNKTKTNVNPYNIFIIKILVFFILVFLFTLSARTISAESSIKFESSASLDIFILDDFKAILGNYEYVGIKINSVDIENFKLFAHFNLYVFHNYYYQMLAAKLNLTDPYMFSIRQLYSRMDFDALTIDIGIKQTIDVDNIAIDPFTPFQRLLLNSSFTASTRFQIQLRQFIGEVFFVSLRWFLSEWQSNTVLNDDIFIAECTGNYGDFRFTLPFIYDRGFDYVRTGWDIQFSLLTDWHFVTALHFSTENSFEYKGFEIKLGAKQNLGGINVEMFYYYNGTAFSLPDLTAVVDDPILLGNYNRGRLFVSQHHFVFISLAYNPDPFFALSLKGLSSFYPFDVLFFLESAFVINTNISLVAALSVNPYFSGVGDIIQYQQLMYGSENGGLFSIKIKYVF